MKSYVDNVIITLKLRMSSYSYRSDVYKEMLYAIEMLECAKRLQFESDHKASIRSRKLGTREKIRAR